jgi:hypothetical protein
MIELVCVATIRDVALKAKTSDGVTTRKMRMTLTREYDDLIAAALGPDAVKARALLKSGGAAKVELPLDAIKASAILKNVESAIVRLPLIVGIKAVGKAPDSADGETPPSISMLFEFGYTRESLVWFGETFGGTCEITITPQQLELIRDTPPSLAALSELARRSDEALERLRATMPAGTTVTLTDGDDDRATAATPEEAEANRAARLEVALAAQREAEESLYPATMIDAANEAQPRATFEDCEDEKLAAYVVAKLETPTHVMEAEGDTRDLARAALRAKLLAQLKIDADAGAPKAFLKAPSRGKGKPSA